MSIIPTSSVGCHMASTLNNLKVGGALCWTEGDDCVNTCEAPDVSSAFEETGATACIVGSGCDVEES